MSGQHINVQELHAYTQTVLWRCRKACNIRTRFVHAVDSQVVMAVTCKGRSSSRILNHALKRSNAGRPSYSCAVKTIQLTGPRAGGISHGLDDEVKTAKYCSERWTSVEKSKIRDFKEQSSNEANFTKV